MYATDDSNGTGAPGTDAGREATGMLALHSGVRSIALGGAESPTHRECLIADCTDQIRSLAMERGGLVLRIVGSGFEVGGRPVPAGPELLDLRTLFQRARVRAVHFAANVSDVELRGLLRWLASHVSARSSAGETPDARLASRAGTGVRICSDLRRIRPAASAAPAVPSMPVWDGCWDLEVEAEESRLLPRAVASVVLKDLRTVGSSSPYRSRALALVGKLLARLAAAGELDAVVAVLDQARRDLTARESETLRATLSQLCTESFVRFTLDRLPPGGDSALAAFIASVGAGILPKLLGRSDARATDALGSMLAALARTQPDLFAGVLDHADEAVQDQALALFEAAGQILPLSRLERLARSRSPRTRARALAMLARDHPGQVDASD